MDAPAEHTERTPKRRVDFDERRRERFLISLRQHGSIYYACKQAGIGRQTAYDAKERDPDFAAEWEAAKEDGLDLLEATAHKRAHSTSDTLLIFLLKAGRPKIYRDPVVRIAETDAEGNDKSGLTDEELIEKAHALIAKREAGAP